MSNMDFGTPPSTSSTRRAMETSKVLESSLPFLKKNNWNIWKFKMQLYLKAKRVIEAITSQVDPTEMSECVYSHIVNFCDEDNVKLIMQSGTAYNAWKRLTQAHENKTSQEKHQIWQEMFSTKIHSALEVQTKVADLQNMAAELGQLNEKVSNTCLMSIIISALPTEFKSFLDNWATQDDQSFDRFLKHLDHQTRKIIIENTNTDNVALVDCVEKDSKDSTTKLSISERKKITRCAKCGHKGHWARECETDLSEYIHKEDRKGKSRKPEFAF